MSTGTDKARLQTLTDAIIAAQVAAQAIPPDERVADVSFGEFETGGWYWEITTQRNGCYGNTKVATTHKPGDYREHNMREVIECGMTAMRRQAAPKPPIVDHLLAAMENDSKLVLHADRGDGESCRGCGRQVGAYHETNCPVAYKDPQR